MKQYEKVFFSAVRAAFWKTPVEVPEGFSEWGQVMALAKIQTLTGLVGDVLMRTPEIRECLPAGLLAKLKMIPVQNLGSHNLLNSSLIKVVSTLREAGVESVLLKGQGIARYYPVPELRQCGDIDLYVGQENYARAYDALLPVVSGIDKKSALEVGKHFHAELGIVTVEVHRYVSQDSFRKQNEILQRYANEGVTKDLKVFDFGGVPVNTPSDNFNVFFIFYHLWHHFMTGGIGLRQFCDWMMILHACHGSLSVDYLESILTEMHLLKPWKALGCVLVDYLGLPAEEMPLYDSRLSRKSARILKRVLREGNFGRQTAYGRKRTRHYIYEKLYSLMCHISRYCGLFFLFPGIALREFGNMFISGTKQVFHDLTHRS